MNASSARKLRRLRSLTLFLAFALFVVLLLSLRKPGVPHWLSRGLFFAIDPLISLQYLASIHKVFIYGLVALVPLTLTLLFGRFFCGWLCPFGAVHEFLSWISGTRRTRSPGPDRRRLGIKYLILAVVIVSALAGTSLAGWLDPFALLTRSTAAAVEPAISHAISQATRHSGAFRPLDRVSIQPVLLGAIFLFIIGLNFWKRRFFCTSLCPLGALYGLVARFGLLRFETTSECNHCGMCARRCSFSSGAGKNYLKSECDVCLACVEDCPRASILINIGSPVGHSAPALDLPRRHLLGTAVAGLALAALPRASIDANLRTKAGHNFLRPPGSVDEKLFLSRCVRCGQCIESCPTGFIQPAQLEAGFDGLWTPVLNAQVGYCIYDCSLCTKACPTGAIEPLTLVRKRQWKLGTAVIDTGRCLTYADGANCTVCVEKCPIPRKPLRFRRAVSRGLNAEEITVQQVYVVPDLCTGCGICEHVCPKGGAPGITISSEDEDREAVRFDQSF